MKTITTYLSQRMYHKVPGGAERLFYKSFLNELLNLARSISAFMILFLFLAFANTDARCQTIGGACVDANFGTDADLYSNLLQFGGLSGASGTDDWFRNHVLYPGSGLGVIDTTGGAAFRSFIMAGSGSLGKNYTFERRMSVPNSTVVDGRLWVDAVYYRDNIATQNALDSSVFSGSSNKNGDDPSTWSLAINGTPQKNDLVDVFAHLRRDGPTADDSLYLFVGSTTISTDGNSHVDYEFYLKNLGFEPGVGLSNLGPDGGHSSWSFNPDGTLLMSGDLLFSVDFENGGTKPFGSLRIWVDPATLPGGSFASFNTLPDRKFNFTGTFDTGENSGDFGYAEISPVSGSLFDGICARVNVEDATLGPPWGTLVGSNADFSDNIPALGFSEASINLTLFGLDQAGQNGNACVNLFGSLMVKTRSSSSFDAELKDFTKPLPFGLILVVEYALESTNINCNSLTATTTVTDLNTDAVEFLWSGAGLVSGETSGTATWNQPGYKKVTVTVRGSFCSKTDSVYVGENSAKPDVNAGSDKTLSCKTISVSLDGSSSTEGATFSWSTEDGNIVSGADSESPVVDAAGTYVLTVTNPSNGCTDSDTVEVILDNEAPEANAGGDKTLTCETTSVSLDGSSSKENVAFVWSTGNGNIVSGDDSPTPVVDAAGTYFLNIIDLENGCSDRDTVEVILDNEKPNVNAGGDKTLTCQTTSVNLDGSSSTEGATFSWSTENGNIVSGADSESPVVDAAGTYLLTVTNPSNGCSDKDTVEVILDNDAPEANAGGDKTLTCETTSISLDGSSSKENVAFVWSTGDGNIVSGDDSPTPVVDAAGTYFLTIIDLENGCSDRDTVVVNENLLTPQCSIDNPGQILCRTDGYTVTAVVSDADSYEWSISSDAEGYEIASGQGTNSIVFNAGECGASATITLIVTNETTGCVSSCEYTFEPDEPRIPCDANAGPDKVLNCITTELTLDGSTSTELPYTILWTTEDGHILKGSNELTPLVDAPGTYVMHITDDITNCMSSDTAVVTIDTEVLEILCSCPAELSCEITSVRVSVSTTLENAEFSWTGPDGFTSNEQHPKVYVPGTYTVTVTNPRNGCSATCTVKVNGSVQPDVNAGPDKVLNCVIHQVNLEGSSSVQGATFHWTTQDGHIVSGANTASPLVNEAGTYTLTVTDPANGCTATDMVVVSMIIDQPACNLEPVTVTCNTQGNVITASSENADTYIWKITTQAEGWEITSGQGTSSITFNAGDCGSPVSISLTVHNSQSGCQCICVAQVTGEEPRVPCDPGPSCTLTQDEPVICPSRLNQITSHAVNADIFEWEIITDESGWQITSGQGTSTITYTAGNPGAVIVRLVVKDRVSGCKDSCELSLQNVGVLASASTDNTIKVSPNPFKSVTSIEFMVKESSHVKLDIYSVTGSKVATLYDEQAEAFKVHRVEFNGTNLSKGMYYYKFTSKEETIYNKLIIIK